MLLLSFFVTATALAGTWKVRADGLGDAPTIQAAIDSAVTGDSILVSSGTYDEHLNTKGKGLALLGEDAQVTVVAPQSFGRVLRLDSGGVLEGLTIQNGQSATDGGGVLLVGAGPFLIRNNIIQNNFAGGVGGGLYLSANVATDVIIEFNTIQDNWSNSGGGGIVLVNTLGGGTPIIRNNLIASNTAVEQAGGLAVSDVEVRQNTIVDNRAGITAGGVLAVGATVIEGNTIAFNSTTNTAINGAGIYAASSSGVVSITSNLTNSRKPGCRNNRFRCRRPLHH